MHRIESLLSARLFLQPQRVGDRLYFISNMSGRMSLYAMDAHGSIPEPLLPPAIALQNPHLLGGLPYVVLPDLDKILVMIDQDGDEAYQPMLIHSGGGYAEPAFGGSFAKKRVHMTGYDPDQNIVYLVAESMEAESVTSYAGYVQSGELTAIYSSPYGAYPQAFSKDHEHVILEEGYTVGDIVLLHYDRRQQRVSPLFGKPIGERSTGEKAELTGFFSSTFTPDESGILLITALFEDTYSVGHIHLNEPNQIKPVHIEGIQHKGHGELVWLNHLSGDRYSLEYNIDGVSWLYEAKFDPSSLCLHVLHTLVGAGRFANGFIESVRYDKEGDRFAIAFSTATSPTQIYTIEGPGRDQVVPHTHERLLGLDANYLSSGEDYSFNSFDGLRISARLYLPADALGYQGPRPLVYYVHGGPQGQERPDFAWFSMPLIQFLTLKGFAVFVPNVRGSTGYGLSYTKHVDRDWGGNDRLDHVEAIKRLSQDDRVDVKRAGVVGRSYGGYMTLTLAARHPELWKAAVDMFGPFDLLSFSERIPETWKPYFRIALGDPATEADFLRERSPKTHIDHITAPLLVIQGKNDPRVVEAESADLVHYLQQQGKQVEYLMFENEGHDVLKFENRVTAYNRITDFFIKHLQPEV